MSAPDTEVRAERGRSAPVWAAAIMLAVTWHVGWLLWLGAVPVRARSGLPRVPEVIYMPMADAASGQDVPAIWSPSVFSLPSRAGFSRSMLAGEVGVRPPLEMPGGSSWALARRPAAEGSVLPSWSGIDGAVGQVVTALVPRADADLAFARSALTGLVMRVELAGGLAGAAFRDETVPELPAACRDKTWEASAYLETDAEGRVKHVFLERRSPSDAFNAQLVRAIRAWRLDAPEERAGRVVVRVFVPTQGASAP